MGSRQGNSIENLARYIESRPHAKFHRSAFRRTTIRWPVRCVATTSSCRLLRTVTAPSDHVGKKCAPTFRYRSGVWLGPFGRSWQETTNFGDAHSAKSGVLAN